MRFSKKLLIANWKMHKTLAETTDFCEALVPFVSGQNVKIALPFVNLYPMIEAFGSKMAFGAQTVSEHPEGAFTGEISAKMLDGIHAAFCIIGHSERRKLYHETDAMVAKKLELLLANNIQPVLCIGETFEEKESGQTLFVLEKQLLSAVLPVKDKMTQLVVAYEPVWAIGSSKAATPEEVNQVLSELSQLVQKKIGSLKLILLYGGSVSSLNLDSFLNSHLVDGVLVGGASLDFETFKNFLR